MDCQDKALDLYRASYNCAQATLAGCGHLTGLDESTALAVAGAFGGGMRIKSICGAVTGALMALGMIYPFTTRGDAGEKERIGAMTMRFHEQFVKLNGCLDCEGLTAGVTSPRDTVCPKAIITAVEIVERMAAETKK